MSAGTLQTSGFVALSRGVSAATVLSVVLAACGPAVESPPEAANLEWGDELLRQPAEWYATADARAAARSVMQYQTPEGGWPKNTDLLVPPESPDAVTEPTFDNGATTTPMRFLAMVVDATGDAEARQAFELGMDYIFAAQYPNGGWPQFFPLREGYYTRITFNDNAMVNVLTLLRDASKGGAPFAFVDPGRRERAAEAVSRGVDVILKAQIRQDGRRTAWCAQHDETTLEPAWARAYEPPSLSGSESVGVVRFLMSIDEPSEDVVEAVEGAVRWLRSVAISGVRIERIPGEGGRTDRVLVEDADAPPLWARFYELGTNRPLYLDRDSVYRYDYSEIGFERRSGYGYNGTWASSLLDSEYPAWRARLGRE